MSGVPGAGTEPGGPAARVGGGDPGAIPFGRCLEDDGAADDGAADDRAADDGAADDGRDTDEPKADWLPPGS